MADRAAVSLVLGADPTSGEVARRDEERWQRALGRRQISSAMCDS
jgi:hypothetical protein